MSITVVHLKQWSSNGKKTLSGAAVRKLLGVATRDTFNLDREALKMQGKTNFSEDDVIEMLKLRLFIAARPGINSRSDFSLYQGQPALLSLKFREWGVDLDGHIVRIKNKIKELVNDDQPAKVS